MTIGIVKVFLLYNRIGQVNLSVLETNVFQASFLPAPKVEMMERTRFWTFLSNSDKYWRRICYKSKIYSGENFSA